MLCPVQLPEKRAFIDIRARRKIAHFEKENLALDSVWSLMNLPDRISLVIFENIGNKRG